MKTFFTATLLGLSASIALAATPQDAGPLKLAESPTPGKITSVNSLPVNTQPEGQLIDPLYCASGTTYLVYNGALGAMKNNNGYAGAMVMTEDAVYIRNVISEWSVPTDAGTEYWIKGDVQSDGSVTFHFPQYVYRRPAQGTSQQRDFYVAVMTPTIGDNNSVVLTVVPNECDLRMKWEGNRLVQMMPETTTSPVEGYDGIVGLVDGEGSFLGYAEQNLSFKRVDTTLAAPSEGAVTTQYTMTYKNGAKEELTGIAYVATEGDNVWFKGFNTFLPDAWVKGTVKDNIVTVPRTYTGVTHNYLTYVTGLDIDNSALLDHLTFTMSEDGYAAKEVMFISLGDETVDLNDNRLFYSLKLTPYVGGVKTPVAPVIDTSDEGTEAWTEEEGMGALIFTLEAKATDGEPLDPEKLYYTVFRNGEPYTFTAEDYGDFGVTEDITDVPYTYQCDLIMSMEGYFFVFFLHDMDTIGVRAVYKDGDNVTYSPTATYVFRDSVKGIATDSPVVSEQYFSLDGKKLSAPADGICIRVTRHADGTIRASKTTVNK